MRMMMIIMMMMTMMMMKKKKMMMISTSLAVTTHGFTDSVRKHTYAGSLELRCQNIVLLRNRSYNGCSCTFV